LQYVDSRRNTKEGVTNEKCEIGFDIDNCNSVVKEALDLFWSSKRCTWHIFRTSVIEKSSGGDSDDKKQPPLHELNE
jgi:hypothetical protein